MSYMLVAAGIGAERVDTDTGNTQAVGRVGEGGYGVGYAKSRRKGIKLKIKVAIAVAGIEIVAEYLHAIVLLPIDIVASIRERQGICFEVVADECTWVVAR